MRTTAPRNTSTTADLTTLRPFGALAGIPGLERFASASAPTPEPERAEIPGRGVNFTLSAAVYPLEVFFNYSLIATSPQ